MSEPLQLTTLGEALVVMDPVSRGPLRHVGGFEKNLGGAELNVAVGLSRLGHRAGWAGRLGDDEFGKEILAFARGEGVDVSRTSLDSEAPTGLYFKEWRALGQLRVHYYRAGSAASRMRFDELDLEYLLSGEILHLTGITAALSESCHDLIERLISAANERGVTVSFDVNVRRGCCSKDGTRGRFWAPSPPAPTCCFSRTTRRSSCSAGAIRTTPQRGPAGYTGRDGGRPPGGGGLRGGGERRLRDGSATRWTWSTPWGRATRSSPVSCPDGCGGGALRSAWTWRTPAERARLPFQGT